MGFNKTERPNIEAMINLFSSLGELKKHNSTDDAIDILDGYLRTGDERYLSTENNFRERVVNSNIREYYGSIYEDGYDHLYYYLDDIAPKKGRSK